MNRIDRDDVSFKSGTEFPLEETMLFDKLVWITSEEAALYLRKSIGALRNLVYRGQIRARKWNRRLYFKRSELDRMLEFSK